MLRTTTVYLMIVICFLIITFDNRHVNGEEWQFSVSYLPPEVPQYDALRGASFARTTWLSLSIRELLPSNTKVLVQVTPARKSATKYEVIHSLGQGMSNIKKGDLLISRSGSIGGKFAVLAGVPDKSHRSFKFSVVYLGSSAMPMDYLNHVMQSANKSSLETDDLNFYLDALSRQTHPRTQRDILRELSTIDLKLWATVNRKSRKWVREWLLDLLKKPDEVIITSGQQDQDRTEIYRIKDNASVLVVMMAACRLKIDDEFLNEHIFGPVTNIRSKAFPGLIYSYLDREGEAGLQKLTSDILSGTSEQRKPPMTERQIIEIEQIAHYFHTSKHISSRRYNEFLMKLLSSDASEGLRDILVLRLRQQAAWDDYATVFNAYDKEHSSKSLNKAIVRYAVEYLNAHSDTDSDAVRKRQLALKLLREIKRDHPEAFRFVRDLPAL